MKVPPQHPDEARRLQALADYAVLDTAPEQALDELTQVAAMVAGTPIALISLVDEHRQWFKSRIGLDATETSRDIAFCAHAILEPDKVLMVEDVSKDERFADNPLVTGTPSIAFYAGVPLLATNANLPIGTLCVVDNKPRQLSPSQVDALQKLARQVVRQLDARSAAIRLKTSLEQVTQTVTALRESERQLLEAQEVAHLGHWHFDSSTGQIWWSKMVYKIFQYPESSGPPSFEQYKKMLHPDDAASVLATIGRCLQQGEPYSIEHKLVGSTGTVRSVRSRGRARKEGEAVLLSGTIQDVTTEALSRAELTRAKELAEAAMEAKSSFLATMSHEIRTPLNGVVGGVDLLLTSKLDDEQRAWANAARASGRSLMVLLNDILDLSKLEAEKVSLENIAFRPADIVTDVVEILGESARAKGIALVVKAQPKSNAVLAGDPNRLRQVLLNLVGNAIKFTEEGTVEIQISNTLLKDDDNELVISVVDTGIGIPIEATEKLFTPFSQADSSTTRRFGGTGLGLAICKRLLDLMQGELTVQSEPGRGTCFTMRLILKCGTLGEKLGVSMRISSSAIAAVGSQTNSRVLLAEDNAINRMIVTAHLKKLGLKIDVAQNGEEALTAHFKRPYDLVLMDCQMPVMDGFEATRRIRLWEGELRRTPIIALTANAFSGDRDACLQAGMDHYLSKPVAGEDLRQVISEWLANHDVPTTLI